MNETLKALHDRFYGKPERKLVLRIIDDETAIAGGALTGRLPLRLPVGVATIKRTE